MANESPDFFKILQILAEHEVEFIIVGGICAVLHGAPVSTFDLDIVQSRAPENIKHLINFSHFLILVHFSSFYSGSSASESLACPIL